MGGFSGEVKYHAVVSQEDPDEFLRVLEHHIQKCGNNYAEVQYQPVMQIHGKLLLTAYVIGRVRAND